MMTYRQLRVLAQVRLNRRTPDAARYRHGLDVANSLGDGV
jgi:hypothetical protein